MHNIDDVISAAGFVSKADYNKTQKASLKGVSLGC